MLDNDEFYVKISKRITANLVNVSTWNCVLKSTVFNSQILKDKFVALSFYQNLFSCRKHI